MAPARERASAGCNLSVDMIWRLIMSIQIKFTHLGNEVSEQLETFTKEKFAKLEKLANSITSIHVTFDVDKLRHIAEAHVHIPRSDIHAKAESEDMYKTVDSLLDKLIIQLKKHKEKITEHG
jgi:putative sigma-54 modulation protein